MRLLESLTRCSCTTSGNIMTAPVSTCMLPPAFHHYQQSMQSYKSSSQDQYMHPVMALPKQGKSSKKPPLQHPYRLVQCLSLPQGAVSTVGEVCAANKRPANDVYSPGLSQASLSTKVNPCPNQSLAESALSSEAEKMHRYPRVVRILPSMSFSKQQRKQHLMSTARENPVCRLLHAL